MVTMCDNCREDITPSNLQEHPQINTLQLNGINVSLCCDCFSVLTEFAKSKEFKEKALKYKKEWSEQ